MTKKILLVEGENDKQLFKKLCGIDVEIKVSTPKDHDHEKNGKMSCFQLLETLLEQLDDGSLTHLALIVDADFDNDHWGFEKTLKKVNDIIVKYGYNNVPDTKNAGIIFSHPNGLKSFGLWIMPNNKSEGMLEDWVQTAIVNSEAQLLQHAVQTVEKLPNPKFKPIHLSKAKVATRMAWQTIPGEGLHAIVDNENNKNLINLNCPPAKDLIAWLNKVYEVAL
jgi:hypothetical protein